MQIKAVIRKCDPLKDERREDHLISRTHIFPCCFAAHVASTAIVLACGGKMTFYDGIYPFYPLQRSPFIVDISLLVVILVFSVLAVSFLFILPGIRGKSRLFWMFRITISLFIGTVLVALNFTGDWAEASVKANASYKSFSNAVVSAEVGLHVGLYGINITLKGEPVSQINETIDYNEIFRWSSSVDEQYDDALKRGLPNPILYIAEKFTRNSACGLIYQYRYSGRFASANLWTAFCCWLVANILFLMPVILYAGYMMIATAAFIFFSMASFSTIFNVIPCDFSIGAESLKTDYSHSFWIALATGLLCAVIGLVVVLLDCLFPARMREVFSVGVDNEDDECHTGEGYLNSGFLEGVIYDDDTQTGNVSMSQQITTLTRL
ncbi:dual oxidase maturation factor 1-like isoform X2 [Carassius auratus]|uniref:Dual oxidase maturation factor 1-like isoform X2 n=1 Tax=Carassius auratus TaxID=7957 RepID=A0A6P6JI58_CARAU|nr:dual oxidase maturation factor 1-like isoform X2 [Carassius auratus]